MPSFTTITSLLAAAALTSAAPSVSRRGAYYVCYNNGFRGDCSVDPCAISWCPDYEPYTYTPVGTTTPSQPAPVDNTPVKATAYYVCGNNGFRGDCSVDPCALSWCPDYQPYTYTKIAKRNDPTVCAPGTGYYQKCSNGFEGCCHGDACAPTGWCPDYKFGTYTPINSVKRAPEPEPASDPTVCAPGTGYFQSCSNGFRGCCKGDACGPAGWCPDYKFGTYTPATAVKRTPEPASDPTVCAPGTGYFQSCSNGFRGCCKSDACSPAGWCPDYKFGSYTPATAPAPAPVPTPQTVPAPAPAPITPASTSSDPTVCSKGYYQVCGDASGKTFYKGCCTKDACSLGYCPDA